jgi:hypothetical protein
MKALTLTMIMLLFAAGSAFSQAPKTASAKSMYFVQIPHTQAQCMAALDDMNSKGEATLSKFEYGCKSGDHTAYAFIEAASDADVKKMLPESALKEAKIKKVDKFTSSDIEKLHKEHM